MIRVVPQCPACQRPMTEVVVDALLSQTVRFHGKWDDGADCFLIDVGNYETFNDATVDEETMNPVLCGFCSEEVPVTADLDDGEARYGGPLWTAP